MRTSVVVCADKDGIASRALDLVVEGLRTGVARRGAAHLALTGGSSAAALFALLRTDPRAARVDWSRTHVWQGDERFVPLDHPDRNWAGALRDWLEAERRRRCDHSIPSRSMKPSRAATTRPGPRPATPRSTRGTLPLRAGAPSFDVLLLGMGGDGHILSAFPGTPPLHETARPVMPVAAPTHIEPHLPRVTLSPFVLRGAPAASWSWSPAPARPTPCATCSPPRPTRYGCRRSWRSAPTPVWLLEPGSAADL